MKANVSSKSDVSSRRPAADKRKAILYGTLAIIAVALVVTVAVLSREPSVVPQSATETHAAATLKVGQTAPAFAVSTTAGPFDLGGARTPVLLEVFATWCPHCQREAKILDALYAKYGKQLSFVAVSGSNVGMDGNTPASQADVVAFGQKFSVAYPIAFDPDLKVAGAYLQSGFPTIVIIKNDKTITYVGDGEIPQPALEKAIKDTL